MLAWKAQGAAFAADLLLSDGRAAKVIVVANRTNPKGLAVIVPSADGTIQTMLSPADVELITPGDYIEILAMQDRAFGCAGLPAPELSA